MYGDAAVVRAAVDAIDGPVAVLGHSYGGAARSHLVMMRSNQ